MTEALLVASLALAASPGATVLLDPAAGPVAAAADAQELAPRRAGRALAITPAADDWRGFVLGAAELRTAAWAAWTTLVVDAENPGGEPLRISLAMRNEEDTWEEGRVAQFTATLAAGRRAAWRIPLLQLRYTLGWTWPDQEGLTDIRAWGRVDTTEIRHVWLNVAEDRGEREVILHGLALERPVPAEGWVDEYGQRADLDWPGKIHGDEDLIEFDRRETAALEAAPGFPDRDEYRAWTAREPLEATGFFRTERVDGRWWLVAPNGRLYYMTGVDVIICGIDARLDHAVRAAYSWMPPKEGRFAAAWGRMNREGADPDAVSFYRANLIRKWGPETFRERWFERALARQRAWGFTSIGNWAWLEWEEPRPWPGGKLPYVTMGPRTWMMDIPELAHGIHDPFHPDFPAQARKACGPLARFRDDPYCIGHFVQNEVKWAEFHRSVLELPAAVPGKARLLAALRGKYRTIERLNRAWGASATSFETLRWPGRNDPKFTGRAGKFMARFRGETAQAWYRGWREAVRSVDADHLILGSRLHQGGNRPREVLEACARWMDVVSFNHYAFEAGAEEFDRYARIAGKPLMIGEYGFFSLDTGQLTTAVPVADAAERGVGFRWYTERLASLPYFVGGHFFQYLDEPITGRFDRETAFNGFVNAGDVPYPDLVRAAQETNARIYGVHAGLIRPYDRRPRK